MTEKFEITDKIFKIVADQAANVKCAFKNSTSAEPQTTSSDNDPLEFVDKLTFNMLFRQRKEELVTQKESILTKQMIQVINNSCTVLLSFY